MPFKSKAQDRLCFDLKGKGKGKNWDCEEWAKKTKSIKDLPEKVGYLMPSIGVEHLTPAFIKLAKVMFDPKDAPLLEPTVVLNQQIQAAKSDLTKGRSPAEYRNELTARTKGLLQQNRQTTAAT